MEWLMEWLRSKIDIGGGTEVDNVIKKEYGYLFRISAIYPYLRGRLSLVSFIQILFYVISAGFYDYCLIKTSMYGKEDISTAAQGIHFFLVVLFATSMITSIALNRNKINQIHIFLKSNYYQYNEKFNIKEVNQWKTNINTCRRFTLIAMTGFLLSISAALICVPLVESYIGFKRKEIEGIDMRLPIPMWHPFSKEEPMVAYALILYMGLGVGIVGLVILSGNVLFIYNVLGLLHQYKILHRSIELLPQRTSSIFKKLYPKRKLMTKEKLKNCYIYCLQESIEHQLVLEKITKLLLSTLEAPIAVLVLGGSVTLASSMATFILSSPIPSVVMISVGFVVAEAAEVVIHCHGCQKLIDQTDILRNVIYDLNWSSYPKEVSIYVKIMLEKSKRPLIFKPWGFFPLSHETITKVMQSAYSYLNLLLAVNKKLA